MLAFAEVCSEQAIAVLDVELKHDYAKREYAGGERRIRIAPKAFSAVPYNESLMPVTSAKEILA